MKKSDSIKALAKALSDVQSQLSGVKAELENPFYKSKYADLGGHWDVIRKPLSQNNLSVTQGFEGSNLVTILMHESGEWIESSIPLNPKDPHDPQKMASYITYMRRYALSAIVGTNQEDDDGNKAAAKQEIKPFEMPPRPQYNNTEYENFIIPRGHKDIIGKPIAVLSEEQIDGALTYWRGRLANGSEKKSPIMDQYLQALEGALKDRMRMPAEDIKF